MEIAADTVVLIHYTLKDDSGTVLDSSAGGEPLAYIQGHGNLVPGLEKALEGKQGGNTVAVTLRRPRATATATKRWCSASRSGRCRAPAKSAKGCNFRRRPRQACACSR